MTYGAITGPSPATSAACAYIGRNVASVAMATDASSNTRVIRVVPSTKDAVVVVVVLAALGDGRVRAVARRLGAPKAAIGANDAGARAGAQ